VTLSSPGESSPGGEGPPTRASGSWWRSSRLLAGVAAGAVLAAAALSGTVALLDPGAARNARADRPTAQAAADRQRAGEVRGALIRMNAALIGHDEAEFVSVVLPGQAAFLAHQRAVYRALTRVPFRWVRYSWYRDQLTALPARNSPYAAPTVVITATRGYDLAGWDARPVSETLRLSFVQRAGHWYLGGDTEGDGTPARGGLSEPWSVGDVSVARTRHVLVIGDAGAAARTRRLATRIEDLLASVSQVWPRTGWNGRVVVYAVTDKRFVSAWFGGSAATGRSTRPTDPATFDALVGEVSSVPQGGADQQFVRAGVRMVLSPALVGDRNSAEVTLTLRHELTHVITDGLGTPPAWVIEGAAEYTAARVVRGGQVNGVGAMARRGLTEQQWAALQKGTFTLVLPSDPGAFYGGDSRHVEDAYTSAWLAMLYIADRRGETTMRRFYTTLCRLSAADDPAVAERRALHDVLHTSRAKFLTAVTGYATGLRSNFV